MRRASLEPDYARVLWTMSARDPLFFLNAFGWLFEPRTPEVLPFITWDFQDRVFLRMDAALGARDIGIEKSRDMTMTWVSLSLFLWRWLFRPHQSFLLVSRNEDLVDKSGDSDSLFWKLDFLLERLPSWLRPRLGTNDRANLKLINPLNGSLITGSSTTGNVSRGGRRTALLLDEFAAFNADDGYRALAATQAVTNTRIFLSTPLGGTGAYYSVMHDDQLDLERIRLHWSEHPLKRPGLYQAVDGRLELLDPGYEYPSNFQHILDGKLRSPWYDAECRRCPIPAIIGQELDIDYAGSLQQFFDPDDLNRIERQDVREPYLRGEFNYDGQSGEPMGFEALAGGPFLLWMELDACGKPPNDRSYVLGVDVATGNRDSAGRGASNSSICIADGKTGEKVGEYTVPGVPPHTFGRLAVALARWLKDADGMGAYLIWESNGPGQLFGNAVIDLGYRRVYYRRDERGFRKRVSDIPGFWSGRDTKQAILGEYRHALKEGRFVNRSADSIREARLYIYLPDRTIAHSATTIGLDPTGARENHGDRVIADALANKALGYVRPEAPSAVTAEVDGSFASRRRQREECRRRSEMAVW